MPIRNDTPNCIPCLRCILGSNLTCFTLLLRLLSFESKRFPSRMYQGVVPSLLLPPSCTLSAHFASGCLIWRNTRHGRSFRTLQLLSCVLNDVVVIGVLWRNVADTSQLTCSIQFRLLLLLSISCLAIAFAFLDMEVHDSSQTESILVVC